MKILKVTRICKQCKEEFEDFVISGKKVKNITICDNCKTSKENSMTSESCGGTSEAGCHNCKFYDKNSLQGNEWWKPCKLGMISPLDWVGLDTTQEDVNESVFVYYEDICDKYRKERR